MDFLGMDNSTEGFDFISYKPSVDKWMIENNEEVDLIDFLLDPASIRTGYFLIRRGISPIKVWDEVPGIKEVNPGATKEEKELFKWGFSIMLYTKEIGVRDWNSCGWGTKQGFNSIFSQVYPLHVENLLSKKPEDANQIPWIKYTGSEEPPGINSRIPQFELVKWVEKPDAFAQPEPEVYEEPLEIIADDDVPF